MHKVVPVVHIKEHSELELLIHYKLYCDVFPYFTLLRALSGLIRLLPDVLTHQVALLVACFTILLSNTRMTIWLSTKGSARHSVISFLPYMFHFYSDFIFAIH